MYDNKNNKNMSLFSPLVSSLPSLLETFPSFLLSLFFFLYMRLFSMSSMMLLLTMVLLCMSTSMSITMAFNGIKFNFILFLVITLIKSIEQNSLPDSNYLPGLTRKHPIHVIKNDCEVKRMISQKVYFRISTISHNIT